MLYLEDVSFAHMETFKYLCSTSALGTSRDTFSRDTYTSRKLYQCGSGWLALSEETGSALLLMRNPV